MNCKGQEAVCSAWFWHCNAPVFVIQLLCRLSAACWHHQYLLLLLPLLLLLLLATEDPCQT
jgi:hypothetical protein